MPYLQTVLSTRPIHMSRIHTIKNPGLRTSKAALCLVVESPPQNDPILTLRMGLEGVALHKVDEATAVRRRPPGLSARSACESRRSTASSQPQGPGALNHARAGPSCQGGLSLGAVAPSTCRGQRQSAMVTRPLSTINYLTIPGSGFHCEHDVPDPRMRVSRIPDEGGGSVCSRSA